MKPLPITIGYGTEHPDDAATALPPWSIGQSRPTPDDVTNQVVVMELAGGWPMRSNLYRCRTEGATGRRTTTGGFRIPLIETVIPLFPILPGFFVNVLAYGAIWFGMSFGFGSARRAIRKKRGRCPMCNYDLRGNRVGDKGCSECGWNTANAESRKAVMEELDASDPLKRPLRPGSPWLESLDARRSGQGS